MRWRATERARVVVFGKSHNIACLAASLTAEADLAVVCLEADSSTARQHQISLDSAVIVFDLSDRNPGLALTQYERPGQLLIGVDPSSHGPLFLCSRAAQALTLSDSIKLMPVRDRPEKESDRERRK